MLVFALKEVSAMRVPQAVLGAVLAVGVCYAVGPKVSPEFESVEQEARVDVIVQFRQAPTEAHHSRIAALGGELRHELDFIRAAHYSISRSQLDNLANDPDVEFISPDHAVFSSANVAPYSGSPDYGWRTVGADLATSVFGVDGRGIGIAVIDSGVDNSQDLNQRVVYRASLVDSNPGDSYGHGNHVAGILAGNGSMSAGSQSTYLVRGIAPNANIISLKALNSQGVGTDSAVIAAIQQAILLKSQYNIRVINLSLGRPVTKSYATDPLCLAVKQAWLSGIVVVVAAGNDGRDNSQGTNGYGTITAPGNSPYVITVGAMNTEGTLSPVDDKITSYTSKGPSAIDHIVKPDLVAPGNRIISLYHGTSWLDATYPQNVVAKSVYSTQSSVAAPSYFVISGTSMATPMVAGAAALMIEKNPALTPDQVKARLMKSASKFAPGYSYAKDPVTGVTYASEYDVFTIGAGYLNIPAALSNGDVFNGLALSPAVTFNSANQTVTLQPNALLAVWGTSGSPVWGNLAVWGSSAFVNGSMAVWGTGAVWGTMAIWGSSSPQAVMAVWGSMAVWGTGQTAGEAAGLAIYGDK